jgi:predicted RNA-binding protein with PIN domain
VAFSFFKPKSRSGTPPGESVDSSDPRVWLVDGYNVLHSGLLGRDRSQWWTAERRNQLLDVVAGLDAVESEIWLVFDGPHPEVESPESEGTGDGDRTPPAGVRRVFAPSADDWLVARLKAEPDASQVAVVTADRKVADRSRHQGAQIIHPLAFLERCRG